LSGSSSVSPRQRDKYGPRSRPCGSCAPLGESGEAADASSVPRSPAALCGRRRPPGARHDVREGACGRQRAGAGASCRPPPRASVGGRASLPPFLDT
jgi:hypothetical protein